VSYVFKKNIFFIYTSIAFSSPTSVEKNTINVDNPIALEVHTRQRAKHCGNWVDPMGRLDITVEADEVWSMVADEDWEEMVVTADVLKHNVDAYCLSDSRFCHCRTWGRTLVASDVHHHGQRRSAASLRLAASEWEATSEAACRL